ncbi:MAG: ABC transporter permease [Ignavibacteria bacterium]
MNIWESIISLAFLSQVIRLYTPYYLGASAANFTERGGVINIAIEGFMTFSAFSYVLFSIKLDSPALSIFITILLSLILALLYAVFTIWLKVNHIVTGIGFNLFIAGLTKFFLVYFFQSASNSPQAPSVPSISLLKEIPVMGTLISDPVILFSFILIPFSQFILFKTRFGLRLRTAGENPEAGDSLGLKIRVYRLYGVLISGVLSSLAGMWLASSQNSFSDGMIAGRGFIAIAAMIIGRWKPLNIFYACLMFATLESLEITLQIAGSGIPSQLIQILPYLITILVLLGFVGKTKPPAADGIPY